MRNSFISLILAFLSVTASASTVTEAVAKKAAIRFISEKSLYAREAVAIGYTAKETLVAGENGIPLYYIFNLDPQGWIIVSGDDAVPPVLAYSFTGSYSIADAPEPCRAWMKQYEDQIRFSLSHHTAALPSTEKHWSDLMTPQNPSSPDRLHSRSIAPLITSNWNQNAPYNAMCPADPAGPGGHAYAGCVPTCMGQLMYYFRWPQTGTGSYSYLDSTYGIQTAVFDTTHYDWNLMTDVAKGANPAIALLLYHLGVSCDLVYGPDGSGMYNHKAAYALRTYFKYNPHTQYVFRDSTGMDWDSILISNLDRKIPLYYAGWSVPNINGHAFVCDGYQDSCYFHFNFGWSGQNNGYFYTSDLSPGGNNFNLSQEVIINCYPDTVNFNYPSYCSGSTEFNPPEGTFEDGSGPISDYLPNTTCTWLINPQSKTDSISSIALDFTRFNTGAGDAVKIYDGATSADPLLASISGDTLYETIRSSGNKLFVAFVSGAGPAGPGFLATYASDVPVWCTGTTTIVADTAAISDGSLDFNYHNGQLCKWKISTASGGPLTLNFRSFDTEEGKDFLKIYDFSTSALVAEVSGQFSPDSLPPPVTVESGTAFLIFTSNAAVTGKGWELYYPKSTEGVEEDPGMPGMRIFPNPASAWVTISVNAASNGQCKIEILSSEGKILQTQSVSVVRGPNQINVITKTLKPGLYLVRVTSSELTKLGKVVIQ